MPYLPWNDLPPGPDLTKLTSAEAIEAVHVTSVINFFRAQDDVRFLEQRLAIAKAEARQAETQYDVTLAHLESISGSSASAVTKATNIREQLRDYELRADGATMLKLKPDNRILKPVPKHKPTVKPNTKNVLYYSHIVDVHYGERSYHDNRHRVTKTITEYRDESGATYRKTYETKAPHEADIVREGTNIEINRKLKQW